MQRSPSNSLSTMKKAARTASFMVIRIPKRFSLRSLARNHGRANAIGTWRRSMSMVLALVSGGCTDCSRRWKFPSRCFGVATALARCPEQVAAMKSAHWEIACHGLKWIEYRRFSKDQELAHIQDAICLHQEATGSRPLGWYTGRCSMNTVDLITEVGGFEYIADSYADELPYWHTSNGRHQLVVPYTFDANDMRFATPPGFNSGDQFFAYLKDTFDVLYEEGEQGMPKMMSVGLHCRLAGRPGRAAALRRFLEYAQSRADVWFARRIDIARHWRETCPPLAEEAL